LELSGYPQTLQICTCKTGWNRKSKASTMPSRKEKGKKYFGRKEKGKKYFEIQDTKWPLHQENGF
jgi:hypothetical protein